MSDILIIAGVATIPSREAAFRQMVASVADQVDRLHVYLSGHAGYLKGLPENCFQHKIEGDPYGDAGKFYCVMEEDKSETQPFYYLSFDDDLLYPPDYVEMLINGIEHYRRTVVCSFHGRSFGNLPIQNYYRGATQRHYCLRSVAYDGHVDVPGTGCMGFHTDTLDLTMKDFASKNMADVHMAIALRRAGVNAICLKHAAGWIRHLPIEHGKSLYNLHKDDCAEQTRRINEAFG